MANLNELPARVCTAGPRREQRSQSLTGAVEPSLDGADVDAQNRGGSIRVEFLDVAEDERAAFEQAQRVKAMGRVRTRLEKLAQRISKGRLKVPEKVGAAAARILARNHGHRYYDWSCTDGAFRFFEHPVHFPREQAYEGKYVIQTEEPDLSARDAVRLYGFDDSHVGVLRDPEVSALLNRLLGESY